MAVYTLSDNDISKPIISRYCSPVTLLPLPSNKSPEGSEILFVGVVKVLVVEVTVVVVLLEVVEFDETGTVVEDDVPVVGLDDTIDTELDVTIEEGKVVIDVLQPVTSNKIIIVNIKMVFTRFIGYSPLKKPFF